MPCIEKDMTREGISGGSTNKDLIYVVDDEHMIAEVVEAILSLEGYDTRLFQDPKLALLALSEADPRPHLLLTDYRMPGMSGMELIEKSKALFPELKTILFSGYVDEKVLETTKVKPDMFMRKPFYPQTLVNLVTDVLSEHS